MLSTRRRLLPLLALLGLPFTLLPGCMPPEGEKQPLTAAGQGGKGQPAPAVKEKWVPSPGDWPLFRGNPLQTGVASSSLPARLEVRWKFKAEDSVEGTAVIANGTVFVGSFDEHLYALNLATGKLKWKLKVGAIRAGPSYNDGSVYVGTEDGILFRLDAVTGKEKWRYDTESTITSSPNFVGDRVLFGAENSLLYCLDANGKPVWKFKIEGGPVNGSPTVAGKHTFVGGCDSKLHVIDVEKGKEVTAVDLGGQTGATAAAAGGRVYIGTMHPGNVQAIDLKKAEVVWVYDPGRSGEFLSSPAVTDKLVIVGSRDKEVHAIDRAKGTKVWSFRTKKRVDASPVVVGDRVYVGSLDGNLYVLDLAKGTQLQKLALGRSIIASAAVGDGCLVVGNTDGVVYCLGKKD